MCGAINILFRYFILTTFIALQIVDLFNENITLNSIIINFVIIACYMSCENYIIILYHRVKIVYYKEHICENSTL